MSTLPGDNKLGKHDTQTLDAYRDKIDPERRGVQMSAQTAPKYGAWDCRVCGSPVRYPGGRVFILKPRTREEALEPARGVCERCHKEAGHADADAE